MLKTKITVISNLFQFNDTVIAINIKFIFLLLTRETMKCYFKEIYEKDKIKSAVSNVLNWRFHARNGDHWRKIVLEDPFLRSEVGQTPSDLKRRASSAIFSPFQAHKWNISREKVFEFLHTRSTALTDSN